MVFEVHSALMNAPYGSLTEEERLRREPMVAAPEWNSPEEIERDVATIKELREYWESLNDVRPPERSLIDPEAIKNLLPYILLVDFEREPFRVRLRLTGTGIDEATGYNLTSRYLDEFLVEPFKDGVIELHQT